MSLYAEHLKENTQRAERWKHLTEGITDQYQRVVLENMLDNTKKWINEVSTTQDVGTFTTFAFPLIRRIFPGLIANELVAIQPMNMPTGKVFYLDFKYGTNVAPTKAGDRMDYQAGKFNPYYGTGARGEIADGEVNGTNTVFKTLAKPIVTDSLVVYVDSEIATVKEIDPETGQYELAEAPQSGSTVTHDYNFSHEGNDLAPEIEFEISDDSISAEQKRLKAKWTLESQQDLYAYHGVDAETELIALLGDEIRREIDRMIVNDLYTNVGVNINWSKTYNKDSGYSKREYDETLYDAIIDAETEIYKKRLVKPNWLVADPETCARLEKMNGFKYDGDVAGGSIQKGLNLYGTLKNKFRVFSDPEAMPNTLLLGYKGSNFFETGYVYAPYIPIYTTPTLMDVDFVPRRAVMSRFGRKLVSNDFYATVTITE